MYCAARRRCRSASCSCRRASSFSFSASSSIFWSACCCCGPLGGLVLVGHLVHLELEQVGQVLGHLAAARRRHRRRPAAALRADLQSRTPLPPAAGTAAPSARAAARRPGSPPAACLRPVFISATACGSSSAIFLNAGSCCTSRLFIRVTRPVDLLAQLRLRQRDHRRCSRAACRPPSSCDRAGC